MIQQLYKNFTTFIVLLVLMLIMPTLVNAKTENVKNQEEFESALKDTSVDTIVLTENIDTNKKITITRPIYIDGKGHTMKYIGTFKGGNDNKVWDSIYILQIYRTNATIKDIKLTGGNAGLLVNGSNVTLRGTIDVSGNGFGGIELSQGKNVEEQVKISLVDGAKIVNTTEAKDVPTLWVPSDSDDAKIEINGKTVTIESGSELLIDELNDLFIDENPNTSDSLILYILMCIISTFTFIIFLKKLYRKEKVTKI